jgi:hypothetical protein
MVDLVAVEKNCAANRWSFPFRAVGESWVASALLHRTGI